MPVRQFRSGLSVLGAALLVLAVGVFVVGEQVAGRTCIDRGVELLVPEEQLAADPEGYGVDIPRRGVCRISDRDGTYTEVSLDRWDRAELALVLAGIGALLLLGTLASRARDRRSPETVR